MRLAGENRETLQPLFLSTLYFSIPIGAFDQANRNASADVVCKVDQKANDAGCATLVGGTAMPKPSYPARPLSRST